MKPLVSVIMPVYNSEKYIKISIESILQQTYQNLELILINDRPTDNTLNVVETIKDDRIRVVNNEVNSGISYSRNKGLKEAKGKYIALMDHDDIAALNRLELEVEYLEKHPEIGAVGAIMQTINELGIPSTAYLGALHNPNFIKAFFMFHNCIANGTTLFRKSIVEMNNICFKENCMGMEDYRFWVEFSRYAQITNIDQTLLYWRASTNSETLRTKREKLEKRERVYKEILKFALEVNGITLCAKDIELYASIAKEDGPPSVDGEMLVRIFRLFRKIIDQAYRNRRNNAQEIAYVCRREFLRILDASLVWNMEKEEQEEELEILTNDVVEEMTKEVAVYEEKFTKRISVNELVKEYISFKENMKKLHLHTNRSEEIIDKYKEKYMSLIKKSSIWKLDLGERHRIMNHDRFKISIIVPVYNTASFLEQCISSLVTQTYDNIEIILVNDGSTDASLSICEEWKKKDERILLVSKENEGLGPTRNYGLQYATGKFVMFLDSDDWLREDALELLHNKIVEANVDAVYFDFVIYNHNENKYERSFENEQYIGKMDFITQKLKNCILPSSCSAIYRLSVWKENKVLFPACYYEDNGVYPRLLILYDKLAILPEGLYFYRVNSGKSITQNYSNNFKRVEPMEYLMQCISGTWLEKKYRSELYQFCYNQLQTSLELINTHFGVKEYEVYVDEFNKFLVKYFREFKKFIVKNFIYFGSYNIGRIGNYILSHDIQKNRYNFSGLITLMDKKENYKVLSFDNEYRKLMYEKEQNGCLFNLIDENKKMYLVLDLLEERNSVIRLKNGKYLMGYSFIMDNFSADEYMEISNDSEEYGILWKQRCKEFIKHCDKNKNVKIVLLRLKLAEEYGTDTLKWKYENVEEIRAINNRLELFYEFFHKHCPSAIEISIDKNWLYTDKNFKYGCIPSHYNNKAYKEIANVIIDTISTKG